MADDKDHAFLDRFVSSYKITTKEKVAFFFNALVTSIAPISLYVTMFNLDLIDNIFFFSFVALFTGLILQYGYRNSAYTRKGHLLSEREHLVTNVVVKAQEGSKKKSRKGALKSEQEVATSREAAAKSIVIINANFFAAVFVCAFFLFTRAPPLYNCVLTMATASFGIALLTSPTYI
eukprot:CAMPEP_0201475410 /NCGR_PEP_ID=MMETSP0151_2-20130828/833_1 /ASSEMBLY_ACC=CAM_ASM_000257 /TAXON_ID=200890 /ORGANISM="Paramoeba atlantica, Strain 621/1 / CCAP 1560/9" /LENGTH=176 /DNA_ID=CAMNT_0047855487 /DNA_START=88 /DNA_END=618 /DNA_ORIENTATION=+